MSRRTSGPTRPSPRGDIAQAVEWWGRAEALLGVGPDIAIGAVAHGSLAAYAAGDLRQAEQRAREALLLADPGTRPADALPPLVYLSMYAYCLGDIARAEQLMRAADELCAAVPPGSRNERALLRGFQVVVEAVRGSSALSDRRFSEALAWAAEDAAPWYGTMVRTLRGAYTARWAPHRSLADATGSGDQWWAAMARYAEGVAPAELDRPGEAVEALEQAVLELSNPVVPPPARCSRTPAPPSTPPTPATGPHGRASPCSPPTGTVPGDGSDSPATRRSSIPPTTGSSRRPRSCGSTSSARRRSRSTAAGSSSSPATPSWPPTCWRSPARTA